jgi:capsular exopolysaccharide synthesis family protein
MTGPDRLIAAVADPPSDSMDFDALLLILRRQAWIAALVIVTVMAGAIGLLTMVDERFRARATMVLTLSDTRVDRTAVQLESFELSRAIVETELDVLRSRLFAGQVAEALSLADHPAFASTPDDPPMSDAERQAAIIDKLLASYSVHRSGESLAVEIIAETTDAELTAAIANGVARTYIDMTARRQRSEIEQSIAFLERRVQALSDELTRSEVELTDFIRNNDLDDAGRREKLQSEEARLTSILAVLARDEADEGEAEAVRADLADIKVSLREHTRAELALMRMERAIERQRSRYQLSVERLNELETQLDFVAQSGRQVTVARVPVEPSWPNRRVALALSLVAAVGLAFVAALLAESFNRRIWSEADAQRVTGVRNLGAVPHIRRLGFFARRHAPLRVLAARPGSVLDECLRGILTLWSNTRRGSETKVLMVTSSVPEEGKSTVAVSLAGSAALDGLRVLLVDLDVHRRGASALSDAEPQNRSLEDLTAPDADIEGLIARNQPLEGLDLLSLGRRGRLNHHVIGEAARTMMPRLREAYDLIVLDTPPVLVVDDACRLGRLADAALIVVRWGWTTDELPSEAYERLARNGIEVAGTVLNDVDPRKQRRYRVGGYYGHAAYGGRRHA